MLWGWTSWTSWLLGGVGFLLGVVVWRDRRRYWKFKKLGLPGPTSLPIFGSFIPMFRHGLFKTFELWDKEYGKIYGVFSNTTGAGVVTRDLDLIKEVTLKQFNKFPNRQSRTALSLGKPWDDVLTSLRDDHWKHVRGQLSPTFSTGKIKKMMPAIQHVCKNLQDALEKKAASGEMVELKQLCGEFSMDVIAAAAFGINVGSLHNPDEPFVKHALTFENPSGFAVFIMVVCPCLLKFFFKIGLGTFPKAAQDFFLGITDAAFKERQQDENAYNDFLQLLIEAQKEGESQTQVDEEIDYRDQLTTSSQWTRKGLTQDEVRANAMLFLLAGYGTVSTTLSWTLFCLANQEDCLKKAQAEVDEKLGKKPVDYDTANDLTYLEMCLNESMRLYPAGFLLQREVREDVELGGVMLQKGMSVSFPIFLIHRDPDIWPDPLKFDPERHTAEARAARHPCAFLPFGIGPRNCIGMRLAQLELRMALASVLQKFTPVPCEKTVYPPTLDKMRMAAVDKLWVKFVARDQQA